MWSSWARPVLPRASLASPARWHMIHSSHVSRHTVYWVQAQVGFGRVFFPGPNRVGARAHFMRWAQPILRLSRRACARANDGLASVNAGQPLMKNLSHFVKSVLITIYAKWARDAENLTSPIIWRRGVLPNTACTVPLSTKTSIFDVHRPIEWPFRYHIPIIRKQTSIAVVFSSI